MQDTYTIGHTIRVARAARGMSQRELARELDVKQGSVAQWETSKTKPARKHWPAISQVLGIPIDVLAGVGEEGSELDPEAIELAVRASHLDGRTRRALLAMVDAWIAG